MAMEDEKSRELTEEKAGAEEAPRAQVDIEAAQKFAERAGRQSRFRPGLSRFFNLLVQTWNTVFFVMLMLGGIYCLMAQHPVVGLLLLFVGGGGAYFCSRQAQAWSQVKDEEIRKMYHKKK